MISNDELRHLVTCIEQQGRVSRSLNYVLLITRDGLRVMMTLEETRMPGPLRVYERFYDRPDQALEDARHYTTARQYLLCKQTSLGFNPYGGVDIVAHIYLERGAKWE